MKKMLAVAAALVMGAAFADVESDNIVGWQTRSTDQESASLGAMFVTPGATTWKLGDIALVDADPDFDFIQFLEWDGASTEQMAYYLDEATYGANAGWYDVDTGDKISEQTFSAGTAFLCSFTSGNDVTFKFYGEVAMSETEITVNQESPFLANPCPRTITLGEVKLDGADPDFDFIQFLEWDGASTEQMAYYLDKANYGDNAGWYDVDTGDKISSQEMLAGDAFLGAFTSGNEITVTFPASVVAAE